MIYVCWDVVLVGGGTSELSRGPRFRWNLVIVQITAGQSLTE